MTVSSGSLPTIGVRRDTLPLRSAQSASTAIDIAAAALPYQAHEVFDPQHTLPAEAHLPPDGDSYRLGDPERSRKALHTDSRPADVPAGMPADAGCQASHMLLTMTQAGNINAYTEQMAAAAMAKQSRCPDPCGSSDVSCDTVGLRGAFRGAEAFGAGGNRVMTPCSPYTPPPLGLENAAAEAVHASSAVPADAVAAATSITPAVTMAAAHEAGAPLSGGAAGSRTRKRKGAALARRRQRAARHVAVAGHLRLKR